MNKLSILLIGGFLNLWLYGFGALMRYTDLSMIIHGYDPKTKTFQAFFGFPKTKIEPFVLSRRCGNILLVFAGLVTVGLAYYGFKK